MGPGGNTSARVGDTVYMKASGVSFEEAVPMDYVGVDVNTKKMVDGVKKPTCEIDMHLICYKVRKDVGAVVHTHPIYATAYAMQDKPMKQFTPDFTAIICSDIAWLPFMMPSSPDTAGRVGEVIKNHNALLIKNHGLVTVGKNLKEAYYRTLLVEDSIKTYFIATMMGNMTFFPEDIRKAIDNSDFEDYRRKLLKK